MAEEALLHHKSRFEKPVEYPERFPVPDHLVAWDSDYPEYDPPYYVSPAVLRNDCSRNPAGWTQRQDD